MTNRDGYREGLGIATTWDRPSGPDEFGEQVVRAELLEHQREQRRGPRQRVCSRRDEAYCSRPDFAAPVSDPVARLGGKRR